MKKICLTLPWFPSELSPNKRIYWRKKNPIKAEYRRVCALLAAAQQAPVGAGHIPIKIVFHPPDKRPRDLDNCLAALKSGLDGVCLALGINDKNLRPITIDLGEPVKGGMVVVEFEQMK